MSDEDRSPAIDCLRAFSILWVLFYHFVSLALFKKGTLRGGAVLHDQRLLHRDQCFSLAIGLAFLCLANRPPVPGAGGLQPGDGNAQAHGS